MVIKINKLLDEDAYRGDLLRRSRYQSKKRYNKRLNYKVSDFRGLDLQELFENNKFVYNTPIKNYVCTIAFDNPLDNIKKYVKNTKNVNDITLQMLTKALIWAYNNEKVQVNCTCPDYCLYPSTEIKLLSGEVVTVETLLDRYKLGEDLWVYSTDEKGDFKPGHVKDVWIKGQVKEFIKVTLDNGQDILTTPEHPYMKRTGEYVEAQNLQVNDSLMPLYFLNNHNYDHRVVNIERVVFEEPVPVYDIEVDKWNNFYVNAGVILHNCYRYKYWATRGGYNYGTKETRPANITNPNNNIGAVCKHLDLLLSNENWVGKTASVLNQFIRAYPEKATYYLYDNPEDKLLNPERDEEVPDEEEDEVEVPETEDDIDIDVEEAPEEDTENSQENEDSENG